MKRVIQLIVVLFVVLLIFQFVILLFKDNHNINYKLTSGNLEFSIDENYNNNRYYFNIDVDKYNFYFSYENKFNKQKKVIDSIEYVKEDDITCIYPVYKNNSYGEILCNDGDLIYSYDAFSNHEFVVEFDKYITDKYKLNTIDNDKYKYIGSIKYYDQAFDNESIMLWNYQGVYNIKKDEYTYQKVLNFDRYENTLSRVVDHYYISPVYTSNKLFEINSFFVWDLTNNRTFNIEINDFVLSNYTYVLGIVNNKLYLFDKSNKLEVEIDINKKQAKIIADSKSKAKFYNGKWIDKNIYELVNNEIYFSYSDISNFNNYLNVLEDEYAYYLYDGYNMYKVYKNNLDSKTLLFSISNIKDITVKNSNVYFENGKNLYKYDSRLYKMMEYSEFEYNNYRLYDIY